MKSSSVIDSLELKFNKTDQEKFPESYEIKFGDKILNFIRIQKGSQYPIASSNVYIIDDEKNLKQFKFEGTNQVNF